MGAQIGINAGFIHWNKDWKSGNLTLAEWTLAQATTPPPPPPPPPSPAKAVTAFSFQGLDPPVVGSINEAAHTIALTVPAGTDTSALVPTIAITGASVSPASGAVHDFTSPVVYTVTAANATTQLYIVTVTVAGGAVPAIGRPYGGGVVAYILVDGDPGYVPGQAHGLIAATADQSDGIIWAMPAFQSTAVPGGTGSVLGTVQPTRTRSSPRTAPVAPTRQASRERTTEAGTPTGTCQAEMN